LLISSGLYNEYDELRALLGDYIIKAFLWARKPPKFTGKRLEEWTRQKGRIRI
jgi:hypothetical protein